ncbi:MAG: hypothetical protein FWB77_06090 [Treponema sp.]|nr:hypothetical protein [Treponema sp.]
MKIMYVITGAIIKYSGIADCLIIAHSRKGRIMDKIRLSVLANKQHCVINKTRNNQNNCSQIIANI